VDLRQLVRVLALLRIAIGAVLLLAPGPAGARWIGEPARDRRVKVALRGLGARDLALGVGAYQALERGAPLRGWVQAAAVADTSDAASGLLALRQLGPARALATLASAGGAAAVGWAAASQVDEGLARS
jgi:hypothetical protein